LRSRSRSQPYGEKSHDHRPHHRPNRRSSPCTAFRAAAEPGRCIYAGNKSDAAPIKFDIHEISAFGATPQNARAAHEHAQRSGQAVQGSCMHAESISVTHRTKARRYGSGNAVLHRLWPMGRVGEDNLHVAQHRHQITYLERLRGNTVKQHLAALRMLFDWLVTGHILATNPAHAVRGPKYVVKRGKAPVLASDEARTLLDSIDVSTLKGLRDRALIGVMVYTFARVSAVLGMKVKDYYTQGRRGVRDLPEILRPAGVARLYCANA
jgi:hypothetical protein